MGLPGGSVVKNSPVKAGDADLTPGLGRSPEGNGNSTPVFLPGKFHGQRSLVGFSPWGCKNVGHDLVTKEQLTKVSYEFERLSFVISLARIIILSFQSVYK